MPPDLEKRTKRSALYYSYFSYFNSSNFFFRRRLSHICLNLKNIIIGSVIHSTLVKQQKRNRKETTEQKTSRNIM